MGAKLRITKSAILIGRARPKRLYVQWSLVEKARVVRFYRDSRSSNRALETCEKFSSADRVLVQGTLFRWLKEFSDTGTLNNNRTGKCGRKSMVCQQFLTSFYRLFESCRKVGAPISLKTLHVLMRICLESSQAAGKHVNCCAPSSKISYHCAYRVKKNWRLVNRKATSSREIRTEAEEETAGARFYEDLCNSITEYDVISPKFVVNFDQICQSLVGGQRTETLAKVSQHNVLVHSQGDRRNITLVVGGTADGSLLPLQVIYAGKTDACHPKGFNWPSGFSIAHNPSHWSTSETTVKYIHDVLKPYFGGLRDSAAKFRDMTGIVILDAFAGQNTKIVLEALREINCVPVLVPRGFTYKFQPMDQAPNRTIKANTAMERENHVLERVRNGLPANWEEAPSEDLGALMKEIKMGAQEAKTRSAQWICNAFEKVKQARNMLLSGYNVTGVTNVLTALMPEEECVCLQG